ncbi:hypothetical protein E2C01_008848 [Portunus trituberculatus]|uniref:Uncharacterized protein n=1 Tax=Portunus trituberculatus TaxID=210409 RepID=A0A5B7D3F5_PORTR|nr:hypothetical protein [Portunus trituberculatus]
MPHQRNERSANREEEEEECLRRNEPQRSCVNCLPLSFLAAEAPPPEGSTSHLHPAMDRRDEKFRRHFSVNYVLDLSILRPFLCRLV